MNKLCYVVIALAVACMIGMVAAEEITIADDDGNGNAYSASMAYTDDGELAVSAVMVTGADTITTLDSGADDSGLLTSAGNVAVVTGADTVVAGSSATEVGGSSASTTLVATGNVDVAEAQGATTSSVIGGSAAGTAALVSASSVDATTQAVARDGASAGTTVSAANMNGFIVQGAVGIGLAAAGQVVGTSGTNQHLYAETWAEAGSNSAETTTVADLNPGVILVAQGAVADPTLLGGFAVAGQYARYGGNGFVGSWTDAEGANSEAEADITAHTHGGSSARMYGEYVQGAATNSAGSIAGQAGTIFAAPGTVHVEAETEAEVAHGWHQPHAETEAEAEMRGTAIAFGQVSGATAAGEVGSLQDTRFWGSGFVATEAENVDGSEAGTFAGVRDRDGYVQTIQIAGGDDTGVAASQVGTVRAPSGRGEMETWAENGNFPGNYASVAVGVEDGQIWAAQGANTNEVIPSDAYATQTAFGSGPGGVGDAGRIWTETEAGDAFGNHAAIGTRVRDGNLLFETSSAYAGHAYMGVRETEISVGDRTTQWANARSFHDRDRDRVSYTGAGANTGGADSDVFGPVVVWL